MYLLLESHLSSPHTMGSYYYRAKPVKVNSNHFSRHHNPSTLLILLPLLPRRERLPRAQHRPEATDHDDYPRPQLLRRGHGVSHHFELESRGINQRERHGAEPSHKAREVVKPGQSNQIQRRKRTRKRLVQSSLVWAGAVVTIN